MYDMKVLNTSEIFYHPSTKLRKGNVSKRVCLSIHGEGVMWVTWPLTMMHWTSQYRDPASPSPSNTGPCCTGHPQQSLPDMGPHCTGIPHPTLTPLDMSKLVHYKPRTVCKWVVGIQLECFLVLCNSIASMGNYFEHWGKITCENLFCVFFNIVIY